MCGRLVSADLARQTEQQLQQILAEAYDTQIERHELEVKLVEARVAQLRVELVRRREAKPRVVEVQLGRIVLEAQGLLGR
ncbi:MAG: hypothetical protein IT422_28995 [Pirellulaceae bacterium]|nr:hypothetical protein [Pirellulaceae bacterium]